MSESQQVPYDEFVENLQSRWGSFIMEARAGKDNRSAALRARKLSMVLRTDLKDFRVVSCQHDKEEPEYDD